MAAESTIQHMSADELARNNSRRIDRLTLEVERLIELMEEQRLLEPTRLRALRHDLDEIRVGI